MKTKSLLAILAAATAFVFPSSVGAGDSSDIGPDRALVTKPTDPVQLTQMEKTIGDLKRRLAELAARKAPEPLVGVEAAADGPTLPRTLIQPTSTPSKDWPPFLKVGNTYGFHFAMGERPSTYGKILEFGPGRWIRVRQEYGKKDHPVQVSEVWLNFASVGSVTPSDSATPPPPAVDGSSDGHSLPFLRVGTRHYNLASPHATGPHFGEIIESIDGWVGVQEIHLRSEAGQIPPRRFWINTAFMSTVTEEKPQEKQEATAEPRDSVKDRANQSVQPPTPPVRQPQPPPALHAPADPNIVTPAPAAANVVKEGLEYRAVTASNDEQLSRKVTTLLAEGWRPHGGVSVALADPGTVKTVFMTQGLVRKTYSPQNKAD